MDGVVVINFMHEYLYEIILTTETTFACQENANELICTKKKKIKKRKTRMK